ncbi:MAG: hypothetical protein IJX02_00660 [Clostridia bacterium]|nr:hypothetical protein [Clostridia bacterium]
MKLKSYIAALVSHLVVLIALVTPIIRASDTRTSLTGNTESSSSYLNIFQFIQTDLYSFTSVLMLILVFIHFLGISNAIYGIVKKKYSHWSINLTFLFGFASALMGALHLYSGSYALFSICAASFLVISFCSIKLIKSEG